MSRFNARDSRDSRHRSFRMGTGLLKALEQSARAQEVSVNAIVNKVLAQAVEAGQVKRVAQAVRQAVLAETDISDWYAADAHGPRREELIEKWRGGKTKGTILKQLRRLERTARAQRDLSTGNKEEWEAQRVADMLAIREVSAQHELITEKPASRAKSKTSAVEFAPIDTEDYDPATHGPPVEPPEDDSPIGYGRDEE